MTRFDDETLMRLIDGELEAARAAEVEAAVREDAAVAARLRSLRAVRDLSRQAFPIQADPRDADLMRLISGEAAKPSPLAAVRGWLADAFAPRPMAVWAGLAAAAFVAGVVLAPSLLNSTAPGSNGLAIGADGAIGDAALTRVLDRRLASQGPDGDGHAVGLTFQDDQDRWCRTFSAPRSGVAGLACRDNGAWTLQALAPLGASATEIRTASSDTPDLILQAVDAAQAGDTLDAAAERQARDGGWR